MDWHPNCSSSHSHSPRLATSSIPTITTFHLGLTKTENNRRILTGVWNSGVETWRERELKRVDRELAKGNHKAALKIVKRMQGKPGGLRGFGAARQVPCGKSSLNQLDLDGVDMQPMVDSMLELVMKSIQSAFVEESIKTSVEDTLSWEVLHRRSKQHEAGHFIVAYLLGVLPRSYKVPNIKSTEGKPNRGVVKMVEFASPLENLNKFSCIALGGMVAAYLEYGYTEGFVSDIDKLYTALNWLEFTESEAKFHIRWVLLNTSQMLLCHRIATLKLADAMALRRSIGYCIATIEEALSKQV